MTGHRSESMEQAIKKMIQSGTKITFDMINENVLKNVYDSASLGIIKNIRQLIENDKTVIVKLDMKKYLTMLFEFDGNMTKESIPALLFNVL